jgi:hypothetical protein
MQAVCSPQCAIQLVGKRKQAAERSRRATEREKVKTRSQWASEAQSAFNGWIRARDSRLPCISCGQSPNQGQRHASHYRSVGAAPQHRFNAYNVHASCAQCNSHKSGNVVEYRIRLADKIGSDRLETIEHGNERRIYDIEYLRRVKKIFSKRARLYAKLRTLNE